MELCLDIHYRLITNLSIISRARDFPTSINDFTKKIEQRMRNYFYVYCHWSHWGWLIMFILFSTAPHLYSSCNTRQEELLDVRRNSGQTPICKTLDIFFHKSLFMGLLIQQDMKYFWSYLSSKLRSNIIKGRQMSATYLQCLSIYLSLYNNYDY